MTKRIIVSIYLIVGLITAILDSFDVLKISLMGYQMNQCALSGNINCVGDGISKMILFAVDIIVGPMILAANIINNPALGIFGVIIGLAIIWFVYIRKE